MFWNRPVDLSPSESSLALAMAREFTMLYASTCSGFTVDVQRKRDAWIVSIYRSGIEDGGDDDLIEAEVPDEDAPIGFTQDGALVRLHPTSGDVYPDRRQSGGLLRVDFGSTAVEDVLTHVATSDGVVHPLSDPVRIPVARPARIVPEDPS